MSVATADIARSDSVWLPTLSLWRREIVRFVRQRSRVIGALGTPVVFWLLIGSGLGDSFRLPGVESEVHYLEYFFPGTVALIVLFTSIFAMISIIEDRKEGFLQAVVAAPVSRLAIVLGKVAGSTTLAVVQALLFFLLAPLVGMSLTVPGFLGALGVLIVMGLGLSGLGFLIAWPMRSTQGFHAIMNLFLIPMWLLSGALFPAAGASSWIGWLMRVNPLTYGVAWLRRVMYIGDPTQAGALPGATVSAIVTVLFAVATIVLAARLVKRLG